jgi:cytochrome oxidase Cu insertion factor (SCO1/SenC/PrrC family)
MEGRVSDRRIESGGGQQWPLLFFIVTVLLISPGKAQSEPDSATKAIENSEAALGTVVGNYRLVDQDWEVLPFRSFAGRAVIISFMYIDCHGPCQLMNQSLANLRKTFKSDSAKDTVFLSITIDSENDKPGALKEYGSSFTDDFINWRFVSTDQETLERMVADLGFQYKKNEMGFDHLNRITLIGPDGTVLQHFYGMEYNPDDVEKSIVSAMSGKGFSSLINRIINPITLYCSRYDPVSKTFKVDYAFITSSVLQYLFILGTLGYVFREKIKSWFRPGSMRG